MAAILLLVGTAARGEQVAVTIVPPAAAEVEIQAIARAVDASRTPVSTGTVVPAGKPGALNLPAGQWSVTASASGYWSPTVLVVPGTTALLTLRPTVRVEGRSSKGPIGARLETNLGGPEVPSLDVFACGTQESGDFGCDVPSGAWGFSLRRPGHVPRYYFDAGLQPGAKVRSGSVNFEPGASVAGWVTVERPGGSVSKAKLRLAKRGGAGVSQVSTVQPNGFFQIPKLEAGDYDLSAFDGASAPDARRVHIIADAETFLPSPLVLQRAVTLELLITPPMAPAGKAWVAELVELRDEPNPHQPVVQSYVPGGHALIPALGPGRKYLLRIKDSAGQNWYADSTSFVADGQDMRREIDIGLESVRGMVTLFEKPVRADLLFGVGSDVQIRMRSDDQGAFEGVLPSLGRWRTTVTAIGTPSLVRTLEVNGAKDADGRVFIEIALDGYSAHGVLVDEKDRIYEKRAILNEYDSEGFLTQRDVTGGRFTLDRLALGKHEISADASGMMSDPVEFTILKDEPTDELKLVMKPRRTLLLRVVGPGDVPVALAQVVFLPQAGLVQSVREGRTDAQGRVSDRTLAPMETERCVAVFSPRGRFAHAIVRVQAGEQERRIDLGPFGGKLDLESSGGAFVVHDGCAVGSWVIRRGALGQPVFSAGLYSLCPERSATPSAGCVSGTLRDGETLRLTLTASPKK